MLSAMDQIEKRFVSDLESVLAAAMDETVVQLRETHLPGPLPLTFRKSIVEQLSAIWLGIAGLSADIILTHFTTNFKHLASKTSQDALVGRIVDQYISNFGANKASQIIQTTERQMREIILGGMTRGEAQEAVFSAIVNKIPGLAKVRAAVITRTESHSVSQFASQKVAEKAGIRLQKTWHTAGDERVRTFGLFGRIDQFNHRVMDGVTTSLDQSFRIPTRLGGFEALLFPGHPDGSPGNVINCRCVQTYERAG
jgi:hypothetical protein